jgi:hypothetical protein
MFFNETPSNLSLNGLFLDLLIDDAVSIPAAGTPTLRLSSGQIPAVGRRLAGRRKRTEVESVILNTPLPYCPRCGERSPPATPRPCANADCAVASAVLTGSPAKTHLNVSISPGIRVMRAAWTWGAMLHEAQSMRDET